MRLKQLYQVPLLSHVLAQLLDAALHRVVIVALFTG